MVAGNTPTGAFVICRPEERDTTSPGAGGCLLLQSLFKLKATLVVIGFGNYCTDSISDIIGCRVLIYSLMDVHVIVCRVMEAVPRWTAVKLTLLVSVKSRWV